MHSPRSFVKGTLLPLLVGALLIGCGSKDETGPKKIDVAAQVAQLKGNSDAKANALTELAAGGPNAASAVNDIIPLLKDEDHVVRRLAALALGQIGPAAKAALPGLNELINDPDTSTGTTALNAINAIDPSAAGGKKVINISQ
jgi:HEAT repeat protein